MTLLPLKLLMQMLGNFGAKRNLCFLYILPPPPPGQVEARALGRSRWEHINTFY